MRPRRGESTEDDFLFVVFFARAEVLRRVSLVKKEFKLFNFSLKKDKIRQLNIIKRIIEKKSEVDVPCIVERHSRRFCGAWPPSAWRPSSSSFSSSALLRTFLRHLQGLFRSVETCGISS